MSAHGVSAERRFLQMVSSKGATIVLIEVFMDESGTGDDDVAHCLAGYAIKPNTRPRNGREVGEGAKSDTAYPFFT